MLILILKYIFRAIIAIPIFMIGFGAMALFPGPLSLMMGFGVSLWCIITIVASTDRDYIEDQKEELKESLMMMFVWILFPAYASYEFITTGKLENSMR